MTPGLLGLIDQHLAVLPVLLPAFTAMLLLALGDLGGPAGGAAGAGRLAWARRIALGSAALALLLAARLLLDVHLGAHKGGPRVYALGGWPAPFGIVLVVDRLSALMLVLTACVSLAALLQASCGWDARGRHFHALFQFQLMGLNGAFVTGDLFNLFVFFEVLLIASYVLVVHGQGRERFRVGLHYVVLNLAASALFLIGVALIYALTGTLNLADLALRVPRVAGPEAAVLQAAALLLLVVFGFKAALMPLALWLPATYAAAGAPVAALFAIMTKVGVYAILRVHGVVFGADAGVSAFVVQPLLLPLALATAAFGALGALAAGTLPRLVAWLTVASVGSILAGVGLFEAAAWSAALYYLAHSTLVIAGLFLLAELVALQRGEAGGQLVPAIPVAQPALLGTLLLVAAASVAGLPPGPGFIGKLMLLQAAAPHPWAVAVWAVLLVAGFFTLIALARAGSLLFWSARVAEAAPGGVAVLAGRGATVAAAGPGDSAGPAGPRLLAATLLLLAAGVAMSVFAAPLKRYTDAAAAQLGDREGYARAVLAAQGGAQANTARPYRATPEAAP